MGYYTTYHLGWDSENDLGFFSRQDDIADYIDEYGVREMRDALVGGNNKWYAFKDDMLELSKIFPETTFRLEGLGEDYDDFWVAWFRDGEHYLVYAELRWPEYDERLEE